MVIERRRSAPTPILGRQFGVEVLWSGPDAFFGLLQDDSRNFERRSKLHFLISPSPPFVSFQQCLDATICDVEEMAVS